LIQKEISGQHHRNSYLPCLLIVLSLISPLFSTELLQPLRTDSPPVIDGKLDDLVWQEAPSVSDFKTWLPDYEKDMSEKTIVYMAYDSENLYFGFKCFDRQPQKIKATVAKRDTIQNDDWISVSLDTFNNQQSGYSFYINPLGIQADSFFTATVLDDYSQDYVIYSSGRINEEGYAVELQIPFKSLRFANKKTIEMGVIFERQITRRSERGTYPALKPERGLAFITQLKPLVLHDIKHYQLLEIIPAATFNRRESIEAGNLQTEEFLKDISLTGKYGFTSNLIFDATYNPDFSQIESDAGQIDANLRYDLYFPEKRPFFLEGMENFNFAGNFPHDPLAAVVYTRKIIDPLAGAKLSGRIGGRNMIATLFALDASPSYLEETDKTGKHALFGIIRYKRALYEDSYIGLFYTGRELKNQFNRVIGPDGLLRLNESSTIGFHLLFSQTRESEEPEKAGGHALGLNYSYSTKKLSVYLGLQDLSPSFKTETGYLTRNGLARMRAYITPRFFTQTGFLQRIEPALWSSVVKDKFSDLWETYNSLSLSLHFDRNSQLSLEAAHATEVFLGEKFNINNLSFQGSSQMTKHLGFSFHYRYGNSIYYSEDPFQGRGNNASGAIVYQPLEKLDLSLGFAYQDFTRSSDSAKIYDYTILRPKITFQPNKYLTLRGIAEYNTFRKTLLTDFLISFLYIPGTVIHLGYGSFFEKIQWEEGRYNPSERFLETQRGIFFKVSYLWRL
jgi:hypothetical protein